MIFCNRYDFVAKFVPYDFFEKSNISKTVICGGVWRLYRLHCLYNIIGVNIDGRKNNIELP